MNGVTKSTRRTATVAVVAGMMASVLVVAGCSSSSTEDSADGGGAKSAKTLEVTLVAYSIPSAAYEEIILAFQQKWETDTGEKVKFTE